MARPLKVTRQVGKAGFAIFIMLRFRPFRPPQDSAPLGTDGDIGQVSAVALTVFGKDPVYYSAILDHYPVGRAKYGHQTCPCVAGCYPKSCLRWTVFWGNRSSLRSRESKNQGHYPENISHGTDVMRPEHYG